jgi:hypothetical protein
MNFRALRTKTKFQIANNSIDLPLFSPSAESLQKSFGIKWIREDRRVANGLLHIDMLG